jgi:hypothetical protein
MGADAAEITAHFSNIKASKNKTEMFLFFSNNLRNWRERRATRWVRETIAQSVTQPIFLQNLIIYFVP